MSEPVDVTKIIIRPGRARSNISVLEYEREGLGDLNLMKLDLHNPEQVAAIKTIVSQFDGAQFAALGDLAHVLEHCKYARVEIPLEDRTPPKGREGGLGV